jgi:hypothetical protein
MLSVKRGLLSSAMLSIGGCDMESKVMDGAAVDDNSWHDFALWTRKQEVGALTMTTDASSQDEGPCAHVATLVLGE